MFAQFARPARLQEAVGEKVRCHTCERRCVMGSGQKGWCRTRENRDGTVYTLIYGAVSSLSCNPIERKPLYHFYPGSVALTAGSWSCNFACPWCQNSRLSKSSPSGGEFIAPQDFVDRARRRGCQGTSISFNEPTLSLEWALDIFPLARDAGLYNTFVTNGYMTEEALALLMEAGLDGMNVDIKGDRDAARMYCQADVEVVWRNCRVASRGGVWIEITTLVVPGVNDSTETLELIARRIAEELGPNTPWHVTRYHPSYRFQQPTTPVPTLERARRLGQEAGLRHVYIGNVAGHPGQNTFCPECGTILVRRDAVGLMRPRLTSGEACPACGEQIAGVGWQWDDSPARRRSESNTDSDVRRELCS